MGVENHLARPLSGGDLSLAFGELGLESVQLDAQACLRLEGPQAVELVAQLRVVLLDAGRVVDHRGIDAGRRGQWELARQAHGPTELGPQGVTQVADEANRFANGVALLLLTRGGTGQAPGV